MEITTEIMEITANITEAITENMANPVGMTWGGLFLIIALGIIIIIWAVSKLMKSSGEKNISEDTAKITVIPEADINTNVNEEDEEELIAVITAAIAAVLKKPVSGFRVVSFKKRDNWR